ncbi:MAG: hypothetical protein A2Y20_01975 [Firmicutes bacterium GWF2_51_9]|jgi:hypothetical protein|nr:MAG: hypothetical protein A2Y20_01975 [Firmicutes bacterium GWF2_51_9]OGS59223.1 MAG: hypothetical protein A2Y19_01120 [Firmicutes bacterium GWE2_51_13]HAM64092.1 hypothetical protein [Erysipelotrichaceae bacterium]HAO60366.1 hypothetical protein [Erysipelotrichaceae bacterium]HBZ41787.1 hypothetical protein [Erysipelotrichaceae bacterium]
MEAALYIGALGAFYAVAYYLNHKTPVPAGCEDLKASCNGCAIGSCGNHPSHQVVKEENRA